LPVGHLEADPITERSGRVQLSKLQEGSVRYVIPRWTDWPNVIRAARNVRHTPDPVPIARFPAEVHRKLLANCL